MRYALLGKDERHAYILDKLRAEGHEGRLLARTNTGSWRGMVNRAASLQEIREWQPDTVLIDSPGFGPLAKTLADEGYRVFGGSNLQDRLQENYLFGLSVLEAAGVPTIEHSKFTNLEDAIEYSNSRQHAWLMRLPDNRVFTFPDTIALQLHFEKIYAAGEVPQQFALQRGYPDSIPTGPRSHEICLNPMFYLCGLFNAEGLMQPAFRMTTAHNLLPEGMGVPTYEGVSLQPVSISDPCVQQTLAKLQETLKSVNYCGWVWLGCVEEWSSVPRKADEPEYGYQTRALDFRVQAPDGFWAAVLGGLRMSTHYFFDRVLNPRRPNTPFDFFPGTVVSRKLSIPPYPFSEASWLTQSEQQTTRRELLPKITFARNQQVFWSEVAEEEPGKLQPTGPVLGYAVGQGESSWEALRDLSRSLSCCQIPYLQVKVEDGMDQLHLDLLNSNGRTL